MDVDKILEAGLLGHCVFCLRKIGKEVPSSQVLLLDGFLNSFNEVWQCLGNQCVKQVSNGVNVPLKQFLDIGSSKTFHSIPSICEACAGTVQAVGELLRALRIHFRTLSQVILESRQGGKNSRRLQQFERRLREGSVKESLGTSTLKLLNSICSMEIQATVKTEPMDHDDNNSIADNEATDYLDNEDNQDSDYIFDVDEEAPVRKKEVCVDLDTGDPLGDISSASFPAKRKRKKRTGGVYTKSSRKYFCRVNDCGQTFQKQSRLTWHQRSCHPGSIPPEVPKFPCTCGKAFFLKRDLDKHIKTDLESHPKPEVTPKQVNQRYTCDMCGDRVTKQDRLEHLIGHVGEDYVLKCPNEKCSTFVTNSTALQAHMKRLQDCRNAAKAKNVGITCEACGYIEEGRNQLKTHIQSVHERSAEKNYKCPMPGCEMRFCVPQSVDLHLSSHTFRKITQQKCEHCSEKIKVEEMGDHLKSDHQVKNVLGCPQCPFKFSSRLVLLEHMRDHRQLGILCDICNDGVKYPKFMEFRIHYYKVHKIGEKKWTCDQCDMKYFSKLSLISHVSNKHTQSVDTKTGKVTPIKKKYGCELCFYIKFSTRQALETHEINVHGKDPFTCDTCGETFKNRMTLNSHKREHVGLETKFKCEVEGCGKVFEKKVTFLRHQGYHGEKTFVCDICGKGYYEKRNLKTHRDNVHLGLRPWVCEECGEGFVNAGILRNHKRIHTGERPFACEVCGQRFRQREVLRRHLEGHEKKGDNFKMKGPMKQIRKRTNVQRIHRELVKIKTASGPKISGGIKTGSRSDPVFRPH